MRSKFDEQLRLLNQEMMYMGTMIEDSIQKAIFDVEIGSSEDVGSSINRTSGCTASARAIQIQFFLIRRINGQKIILQGGLVNALKVRRAA